MNIPKKKLFITGGSGYLGRGIIKEFLSKNWDITALVRDIQKVKNLEKFGVKLVKGQLSDSDILLKESANHDVIIHAARDSSTDKHDLDLLVINTLIYSAKLTSETKTCIFIYTSGIFTVGEGDDVKDESCHLDKPHPNGEFRVKHEEIVINENNKNNNLFTAVIRPSWVYGENGGYVSEYLRYCQKEKYAFIVNNGDAFMNFIHLNDLARLYYLVGERNGSGIYHGTDSKYVQASELVKGVAKYLNVEIKECDVNTALEKYGLFAVGQTVNQKVISIRSYLELGWQLEYSSILECLDKVFLELNN